MKGRLRMYNNRQTKENMHCLICDASVGTDNACNILYTVLPNGGSLLCDIINKVLRRNFDATTTRSTILCNRCFGLFNELDAAESRCAAIKKEIETYYLKTCEVYDEEYPLSVPGVGCQTETTELESSLENEQKSDLKLKIALVSKRKRGRPVKAQPRKHITVENIQNSLETVSCEEPSEKPKRREKQLKKENETIIALEDMSLESRRTRSTSKSTNRKKQIVAADMEEEDMIKKEESEEKTVEKSASENDFSGVNQNGLKFEDNSQDEAEVFPQDYLNNDDDDFEWKEEPLVEIHDESPESEEDIKEEKTGNEEDWQSSGSRDSKKKQKRKKKRKRGDRRGERAFMVPIHECNQCGKKWRTVTELKSHVASHSDVRPFVCEICGQAYKMKKALDIHIGMHNGIHPFVCTYCNKSFTQKVGLEKHLPIHTGVTRFQCDLCGKRFIHQKSFNIHKMTHTGEKNIHCPICKLAVFSQSHLKRHYRVHTGERPYGCNICGKKFAEKYNLNAHTRIHDPNSAGEGRRRCHTCPICGMTYDRKHKMADHLSSVHCMWQSSSVDFKSEDFYNMDVQQTQAQHHLLPVQAQHSSSLQSGATLQQGQSLQPGPQQQQQQSSQQQQTHVHQQSQPPQINPQAQPPVSQGTQQAQQPQQMVPAHQSQQHHHMSHHQQPPSHHLQQHHNQSGIPPPHHILVTQHHLQQTLQTHLSHHPAAAAVVTPTTPPSLQPINSVFQLVSVQPTPADAAAAHHNRMNTVSASMAVPTL